MGYHVTCISYTLFANCIFILGSSHYIHPVYDWTVSVWIKVRVLLVSWNTLWLMLSSVVTFRYFRKLNIALAKPITTPRKNFQRFPYVEQQEKRRSNPECWDALLCKEGNMTFWDFFSFFWGKLIRVKADKCLRFNLTILPYWVYSDILIRIWFNNLPKTQIIIIWLYEGNRRIVSTY